MKNLTPFVSRCCCARRRAARPRRAQGARHHARLGRAHARSSAATRQRVRRDHRAAGRASRRGQTQPGGARAQRGPGRRHRRRARSRLAAGAASRSPATRSIQPGAAGYFEAASALQLAGGAVEASTARWATSTRWAIRTCSSIRTTSRAVAHALTRAARAARTRAGARTTQQRGQGFRGALDGGDRSAGRRRPRRSRACSVVDHASRPGLSVPLAGPQRGRVDRAQARRAADRGVSRRSSSRKLAGDAAEADPASTPTTIRRPANWLSERVHAPVVVLPFSVGGTPEAKDLFGLFDDTLNKLLAAQMNTMLTDFSILWPALIAGVLVAISHVPLGQQVLSRGIVFIDLAIAQVAGLGVIAANCFELPIEGWGAQIGGRRRGAGRRAAAHLDRAQAARSAGGADRHPVRARVHRADPVARQRSAWRREPQGPAGRADPLGVDRAADPHRGAHRRLRAGLVQMARAHRPHRLLRAVRARGDGVGAARRRVPGVHQPDRAGGGDLPACAETPAAARLRAGDRQLRRRASACRWSPICRRAR